MSGGQVVDANSTLIPIFSDVIAPDLEITNLIGELRALMKKNVYASLVKLEHYYTVVEILMVVDNVICDAIREQKDVEIVGLVLGGVQPFFRHNQLLSMIYTHKLP